MLFCFSVIADYILNMKRRTKCSVRVHTDVDAVFTVVYRSVSLYTCVLYMYTCVIITTMYVFTCNICQCSEGTVGTVFSKDDDAAVVCREIKRAAANT